MSNDMTMIEILLKRLCETQELTNKHILELATNGINNTIVNTNNTTNHTTNHTTSHTTNNNFNIKLFLNETCKDALNIEDFLESIVISIPDLKYLANGGYVEAMTNVMIKNLKDLEINERPMHCTDVKRETIYIKDKNIWEKDNDQKAILNRTLVELSKKNTRALTGIYKETYPCCMTDRNSKEHREYGEIAYQAFGGKKTVENQNKSVIRKLAKEIKIDRSSITS